MRTKIEEKMIAYRIKFLRDRKLREILGRRRGKEEKCLKWNEEKEKRETERETKDKEVRDREIQRERRERERECKGTEKGRGQEREKRV